MSFRRAWDGHKSALQLIELYSLTSLSFQKEIVESLEHLFVCNYHIGVCLREVPRQNAVLYGRAVERVFFNLAVPPVMDDALG